MRALLIATRGNRRKSLRISSLSIATAIVFLLSGGLESVAQEMGFNPKNALTLRVTLPEAKYKTARQQTVFYDKLTKRIEPMPGVDSVGAVSTLPLSDKATEVTLIVENQPGSKSPFNPDVIYQVITPEYFRAMRIPLLSGRSFVDADKQATPPIAIINENVARLCFPDMDPIGQRIKFDGEQSQGHWITVVGVVGNTRQSGADPALEIFVPYSQNPRLSMSLVIRTSGEPMNMANAAQSVIESIDKEVSVSDVVTLEKLVRDSDSQKRSN